MHVPQFLYTGIANPLGAFAELDGSVDIRSENLIFRYKFRQYLSEEIHENQQFKVPTIETNDNELQ
jgi:hypothetical protein